MKLETPYRHPLNLYLNENLLNCNSAITHYSNSFVLQEGLSTSGLGP